MSFSPAKLRDQREHRGCVLRLARKVPQHHAGVIVKRTGKAGAREELCRFAVVCWRGPGNNLLQCDREFVGAEGTSFPHFAAGSDDLYQGSLVIVSLDIHG